MPGTVLKAFIVSKIPTGELDCGRVCFSAKLKPAGTLFFFFLFEQYQGDGVSEFTVHT